LVSINLKTKHYLQQELTMHAFGQSVKLHGLINASNERQLALVEDAADSLSSFIKVSLQVF